MKTIVILMSFIISTIVSTNAYSQSKFDNNNQVEQQLSEAELAQILAPIALYPDSLLTHILISSTYPIEIVEAHRWIKKNNSLDATQISDSIINFNWDASVKALVPFEPILSRLSEDLSWTQKLGDAFLLDETKVLDTIQTLREKAKQAGNLSKMGNMEVSYEDSNIVIEPIEKEIVYVPYYDTRKVYGSWYWSSFPPVFWRPTHHVYVNIQNPFYWFSGVRISFNYFFSAFHWHKRHVVVGNPYKSRHYRSRHSISSGGSSKHWVHKPTHRKGVKYKNRVTHHKYSNGRVKYKRTRHASSDLRRKLKDKKNYKNRYAGKKETPQSHAKNNKVMKRHSARQKDVRREQNTKHSAQKRQENTKSKQFNRPNNTREKEVKKADKRSSRYVYESKNKRKRYSNNNSQKRKTKKESHRDRFAKVR